MSTVNIFQISLEIWGGFLCIVLMILAGTTVYRIKGPLKNMWDMLFLNCFFLAFDTLAYVFRGDMSSLGLLMTRVSNFGVYFTEGILMWMFAYTIQKLVSGKDKVSLKNPAMLVCTVCILLQLVGIVLTPFTKFYYYFDEMNYYVRGNGIFVSFGLLGVVLIISNAVVIRHKEQMSQSVWKAYVISAVIFFLCVIVQFFFYGLSLVNIGVTISLLLIFVNLWLDSMKREFDTHIMGMDAMIEELRREKE